MNLELLQSFGQSYPEEYDGSLDSVSVAVTATFNRRGSLLAVGCNDGRIVIWDFLTRGIAKILSAHVHPVTSVSWSRNGRKLLSGSTDWNVSVWDVLSGECDQKYRFQSPVSKVQFHPRNNKVILVCPMKHAPVLVKLDGQHHSLPAGGESEQNIVASFDRKGEYIYTGNSKGKVLVIDAETYEVVTEFRIQTGTSANTAVKAIEFARRGSAFLINSQDRIIRVFDSQIVLSCQGTEGAEPEPIQKLQDLVNRTLWKKCCFSGDGEYICAGSSRTHALYIWEKGVGNLVKILHGTKGELLLDVVWHPIRPIIASISSGVVSIWAQNHVENWSAFAPDFKELDENVEYEEKENEFDIEDEDEEAEVPSETEAGEEDEVDVCTVERIPALCSSDEENDEDPDSIYYLPVAPEIDDPEETGWTQEFSQNDVHPTGVERKRSATQESNSESQKKKIKVIDIRNGSSEQESKSHGINKSSPQSKPFQSEETSARNLESVSGVAKTNEIDKQANTDIDSIFE
ncbi:retinoblastoma-binding protein 5 homolog isoform X1 [Acropora millepora]|uniref:retinoblastoma-binding protein 5 homolog isoform X1 n=1 Tax=Acropora millepora TaxID=45264 RepID=UPI0010FCB9E7|nr:retinoblastoma-binding protein 5 homolog isoform X1 [Acropora millepora]